MRDIFKLQERSKIKAVSNSIMRDEPDSTKELTNRAVKILDAKYEKADLPEIVDTMQTPKCTSAERTVRSSIRIQRLVRWHTRDLGYRTGTP